MSGRNLSTDSGTDIYLDTLCQRAGHHQQRARLTDAGRVPGVSKTETKGSRQQPQRPEESKVNVTTQKPTHRGD